MKSHKIAAAFTALLLTAGITAHANDKVTIAASGLAKQIHLPEVLCAKLGFFAQQGLDVEYVNIGASGVNAENELIAGVVDAASSSYDHTIDLQSKGKYITAIAQFMATPGEVELVGAQFANEIKRSADLKDRTLGVSGLGGMTDHLTHTIALQVGLSPKDISLLGIGADATFIAAMVQGKVQGGMVTDLTASRMISAKQAVVLADMRTPAKTLAALGSPYPGDSLYVSEAWLKSHQDQAQRLVNAFVRTMQWMSSHSAEDVAAMVPKDYYVGSRDLYVSALAQNKTMFTPDGRMPAGAPEAVLKILSAFNPTVKGAKIDLSRTYTGKYVDAALRASSTQ